MVVAGHSDDPQSRLALSRLRRCGGRSPMCEKYTITRHRAWRALYSRDVVCRVRQPGTGLMTNTVYDVTKTANGASKQQQLKWTAELYRVRVIWRQHSERWRSIGFRKLFTTSPEPRLIGTSGHNPATAAFKCKTLTRILRDLCFSLLNRVGGEPRRSMPRWVLDNGLVGLKNLRHISTFARSN
jgi:hypothetical protein